jgi:hypothetical protein
MKNFVTSNLTTYYLLLTTFTSNLTTYYLLLTTFTSNLTTYYLLLTTFTSNLTTYYFILTSFLLEQKSRRSDSRADCRARHDISQKMLKKI